MCRFPSLLQSSSTQPVYHPWKFRYNRAATLLSDQRWTHWPFTSRPAGGSSHRWGNLRRCGLAGFTSTSSAQQVHKSQTVVWLWVGSVGSNGVILHCSLPGLKFISKAAEMVGKKQKKLEKEEKEFRKKFKVCPTGHSLSRLCLRDKC